MVRDEGAFSQIKKALGSIHIDMLSSKALAKNVLDSLVSVHVYMRKRLCLYNINVVPAEQMTISVSEDQRNGQRQQLKDHKKAKAKGQENQLKLDHLQRVIDRYGFELEAAVLKRAQYSTKFYELEAINEAQKAFVKATNKNADRCNLSNFLGILKNIQQQRDEQAIKQYCRNRGNYQRKLDMQRKQDAEQKSASIDDIIRMLEKAVTKKPRIVEELAIRRVRDWILELVNQYSYMGSLKKKLSDALGKLNHLNLELKLKAWELIEQFLNPKSA